MAKKKSDCAVCGGQCCRYFGLPIETPETPGDFDDVRWYLLHAGTEVYVDEGDWYLNVKNTCKHLQQDSSCAIYSNRPRICRQYSMNECEATSDEYEHEHHFNSAEELEAYARNYLRKKRRQAQLNSARRKARQQRSRSA